MPADSLQMEAGSDTTASTLLSFLLAMINYPQQFEKAQREVDEVCGLSRSPTADDINNLPFIKACMDEVRRDHCAENHPLISTRRSDGVPWHQAVSPML